MQAIAALSAEYIPNDGRAPASHYRAMTEWNPEPYRAALRAFMTEARIKAVSRWEREAGTSEGVLRKFLNSDTQDIGLEALHRLATAANAPIGRLIGDAQGGEPGGLDPALLREVIAELERYLERLDKDLPAEKKAEAVTALYELAVRDDRPGRFVMDDTYASVIRLAFP
jgi:hypothetical protein